MKAFVEPPLDDFCINRIAQALKKYAPTDVKFVDNEAEADLVVIYAHGLKKHIWWTICRLKNHNQRAAVIQMSLKSTPNSKTSDWLAIWENAAVVWSYYNLAELCRQEGNPVNFNFYHAPLGVDTTVFQESRLPRKYVIGIHSKGWSRESLEEVVTAARAVGMTALNFETEKDFGSGIEYTGLIKNDDASLARYYSQCKYVSGLRRVEGFELPVIEGLMCGARPICFDLPTYHQWFDGLAEFIPESGGRAQIIPALINIFKKEPQPVGSAEKQSVTEKFNWGKIVKGFWEQEKKHGKK